jgi:hypothetical protein
MAGFEVSTEDHYDFDASGWRRAMESQADEIVL